MIGLAFMLGGFTVHIFNQQIVSAEVKAAATIMGLEFTQSEIDSMLPGLERNRSAYLHNRQQTIPNSLAPALDFNPFPIAFELPHEQLPVRYSEDTGIERPADDKDLSWFTIRQLAELIKTRQISSEELTRFYLDRLKKYDPTLHCVITLTEELALEQARRADAEIASGAYRGLLHGIPYGAKDLLAVEGYPTTWGAMPYREQVFAENATVVERLEAAGAGAGQPLEPGARHLAAPAAPLASRCRRRPPALASAPGGLSHAAGRWPQALKALRAGIG